MKLYSESSCVRAAHKNLIPISISVRQKFGNSHVCVSSSPSSLPIEHKNFLFRSPLSALLYTCLLTRTLGWLLFCCCCSLPRSIHHEQRTENSLIFYFLLFLLPFYFFFSSSFKGSWFSFLVELSKYAIMCVYVLGAVILSIMLYSIFHHLSLFAYAWTFFVLYLLLAGWNATPALVRS